MDTAVRVDLYRTMVLIRTFSEAIRREYHVDKQPTFDSTAGQIPGDLSLPAGQEPVAAGVCANLTPDDAVTGGHRAQHVAIAHGVDLDAMVAEIFGRATGLSGGRGGARQLFDAAVRFSSSGTPGAGLPIAIGRAFAFQRDGSKRVAVAFAGEGTANTGAFHESLNLAALWRLPVVFVLEDNGWATSVPRSASTSVPSNGIRASSYGIPGERVPDNAVEQVYDVAERAVGRARGGRGPSLIEVQTVRLWGHSECDAQSYREGLDVLPAHDPIPAYEQTLIFDGALEPAQAHDIHAEARARVADAIGFAKDSPVPDTARAGDHVFA